MAYKSSALTYAWPQIDLLTAIRNFTCGYRENNDPVFTGANGGTVLDTQLLYFGEKHNDTAVVTGTWTVECTTAGAAGGVGAEFSVLSTAYAGPFPSITLTLSYYVYDEPQVTFYLGVRNNYQFVVGDKFEVVVTGESVTYTSIEKWTLKKQVITNSLGSTFFQLEGPGLTDDKTINVLISAFSDSSSNRYSIGFKMATGYLETDPYDVASQPGIWNDGCFLLLQGGYSDVWNVPYHLFVNKQRMIVLCKAGNTFRGAYSGFFYPYGSAGQYPFPMYNASDCNTTSYSYDGSDPSGLGDGPELMGSFVNPRYLAAQFKAPGNSNQWLYHYDENGSYSASSALNQMWPVGAQYGHYFYINLIEQMDGKYSMFPCVVQDNNSAQDQMLGELDGVCALPGRNLNPGDVIEDSESNQWLVWKDTNRSEPSDYYAVRLL